jgi:diguanylate cyclase (GGDEF)-like protein/PAS domain S-box-containing protein
MNISWSDDIIHHVPEALLLVDNAGTIVWSNHRVEDLLGYQSSELQGRQVEVLIPERYHNNHVIQRHAYSQSPCNRQMGAADNLYACNKQGHEVPVDIALSHLYQDGKMLAFIALRSDVLQREQRNHIKKQEEFLRQTQTIGHIGSWDWNIIENNLEWSDEVYRIFGISHQSPGARCEDFLNRVHPDDRQRVNSAIQTAINDDSSYHIEHRVLHKNGEHRHVIEHGKVYRNNAGEPIRMLGTVQDVTKDREKQERLLLSRVVFDNCAEGIAILDNKFRIIDSNPVFNTIIEATASKYGQEIEQFFHPQSPNSITEVYLQLQEKQQWKGEVWVKPPSQKIIPTLTSVVAVSDGKPNPSHYVVTVLDITDLKESKNQLKFLTNYDPLTLLPNRTLYLQHLKNALTRIDSSNYQLAVFYIDLDGFKQINDSQGHDAGDQLLKEVADNLHRLRSQYIFAARLGGDEFALIVEGKAANRSIDRIAKLLVSQLNFSKQFDDCILDTSVSVGISRYGHDSTDYLDLMRKADQAMYQAKERGRNTYCYYDTTLGEQELDNIRLASAMREGLEQDQYKLYYQPKVCLKSNSVVGFEALIRWQHPNRGLVSPVDFIPLAETSGLIIPIGLEVLSKACTLLKKGGIKPAKIAVNLSAKQLHSSTLITDIQQAVDLAGLKYNMLEIEITESVAMENVDTNLAILHNIKSLGISIAIDDFGTGYSSLSYLKQLPVDVLKIDRSFIINLISSPEDKAIVTAIISLAKSLGLKVIAEGVEDINQLNLLKIMGCDEAQGYFFSKPVPESELPAMTDKISKLMTYTATEMVGWNTLT